MVRRGGVRLVRLPWLILLLLLGCERKAPGPAECRAFAYRVNGVTRARQLDDPRVRLRVDELIRACLVTPYDRAFLRCVDLGAPASACEREFQVRNARRKRE